MITHHETCNANYPEKPEGESPQHVTVIEIDDRYEAHTCSDCGSTELVTKFRVGDRVYQRGGDPEDWGEVTHINENGLIVDLNGAMEVTVRPEDVLLRTYKHRAAQIVFHNWRLRTRLPRIAAFGKQVYGNRWKEKNT